MSDVDASIVEKVRKILTKAERTDSVEEAEVFFAKATELMQKHMIDEAMLAAAGGADQDKIDEIFVSYGSTYWQAWRTGLGHLSRALGFYRLIVENSKNGYDVWYGWRSELKMAEVLIASMQIQVERAGRNFMNGYQSPSYMNAKQAREDRFKAKRSFVEGFLFEVSNRIALQRAATLKAESERHGQKDGSLLPVLMDRSKLLLAFFDDIPTRKIKLRSSATNVGAHGAGVRAGGQADIGQPRVGGGSRGALGGG